MIEKSTNSENLKSPPVGDLGGFGLFFLLLFFFAFSSCETPMEFKGEQSDPMLVVNAFLTPDSLVKVHVSASRFFLLSNRPFQMIDDAAVSLTQAGNTYFLENIGGGYYISTKKLDENEELHIEVSKNGFKTVSSTTGFPTPVPIATVELVEERIERMPQLVFTNWIDGVEYKDTIINTVRNYSIFNIKFSDPPNVENFYRLFIRTNLYYKDEMYNRTTQIYFDMNEFLNEFSGNVNDVILLDEYYSPYYEFSDITFDGKELSVSFDTDFYSQEVLKPDTNSILYQLKDTYGWYGRQWEDWNFYYSRYLSGIAFARPIKREIVVELQSLSQDYYLYLRTRNLSEQAADFGNIFGEPIQIFNNIRNGIGILGSYTSSTYRLELYEKDL